ncbi:restriction endonuclease subunit S [Mycoplasma leonicaptivi]|uniref:restriction endonuclease subunit S n=1 Tax=Mycoplasma leonicaptivi TaxID=36742 RepID=UPI000A0057F6|nr:restriction endonuclease subunit S [Mycoplasma leonicaptivi]
MTPEQIKNSILQYAIQGKLVEQRDEEGSAQDLYEQIQKEKAKLIKEGKIKKQKDLLEIKPEEIPFEIPKTWKWVRLGRISHIYRGSSPRPIKNYITSEKNGVNWIKIGDTDKNKKYIEKSKEKINKNGKEQSRFVEKGTLLLTNSMSFGQAYILNIDGCIHDGWLAITKYEKLLLKEYLYYVLKSNFMYSQFIKTVSGSVVQNLSTEKVNFVLIPLPPFLEQKRIVDKIEELMSLVEGYSTSYKELELINSKFPKDIKNSILQYAIQGKLVEQRDEEEPIKLKQIKNKKTDELEFDIPNNWKTAHLESITQSISIKKYQVKTSEYLKKGKYPIISQSKEFIIGYNNDHSKVFKNNDSVVVFGDHTSEIKYIDFDFIVGADGVKIFKAKKEYINTKFLKIVLEFYSNSLRSVSKYTRNYKFIKNKPIPSHHSRNKNVL